MDCIVSLRGEKWPKWHAIYSMYTARTLIVTLRNAKVHVCAARIHFENCILCNFRALSVQYNPFVSYIFFILLVCSHDTIVNRAVLKFPQLCHLGIHGIRHRLCIYISILVLCLCQEEVQAIVGASRRVFASCPLMSVPARSSSGMLWCRLPTPRANRIVKCPATRTLENSHRLSLLKYSFYGSTLHI